MKISKLLPVLCALAVGANGLNVRADDTPAQAAARAALAKQLPETGTPPPSANAVAGKTTDDNVVMTPVNNKEAKAKAKVEKAAAAAKAKQQADQAAADLKLQKEADKKLAAQRAADTKSAQAQAEAKAKADKAAAARSVKPEDDKNLAAQKAALAAALADRQAAAAQTKTEPQAGSSQTLPAAKPVAHPPGASAPQPAKTAAADFAGKDLGMQPIAAPALPIAASKEERLQALLGKYKTDQISPEAYFKQRAAILAEP